MDTNPNDMSCKELVELVTDYLEGALSPARPAALELHIGKCEWCKLYIDQVRLTVKADGKLTEDSLNPQAKEEVLAVFRNWKNSDSDSHAKQPQNKMDRTRRPLLQLAGHALCHFESATVANSDFKSVVSDLPIAKNPHSCNESRAARLTASGKQNTDFSKGIFNAEDFQARHESLRCFLKAVFSTQSLFLLVVRLYWGWQLAQNGGANCTFSIT